MLVILPKAPRFDRRVPNGTERCSSADTAAPEAQASAMTIIKVPRVAKMRHGTDRKSVG